MRVEDTDGWLRIDVGSGQDPSLFSLGSCWACWHVEFAGRRAFAPSFFPWAHVGLAGMLSLLAEGHLTTLDAWHSRRHVVILTRTENRPLQCDTLVASERWFSCVMMGCFHLAGPLDGEVRSGPFPRTELMNTIQLLPFPRA